MRVLVAPSILPCDFSRLGEEIRSLEEAGADMFHLDVMDGAFVPNLTFGPVIVEAVRKLTDLPLDAHLMINNPLKYVRQFAEAGADYITVHVESRSSLPKTLGAIKTLGKKPGVAVNPGTALYNALAFMEQVSLFLIMGVDPGFYGQKFNPSVLRKVEKLKSIKDQSGTDTFMIGVDGGMNLDTGALCAKSGAELLVSGAFVVESKDRKTALHGLKSL
jgi:ribulose-phosphate 3-epimerase